MFRNFMDNLLKNKQYIMLADISRETIETNMNDWVVDHYLGRIQCSLQDWEMSDDLKQIITKFAKKFNENAEFRYVSFVRYSKDFGYPQLGPHLDPPTKEHFMFDIQLRSTLDWPIVVAEEDGIKEYTLDTNDALVLEITRNAHWRKPLKFKDDDYLDMLFFSYTDNNLDTPSLEWQSETGLKHMDAYNEELAKVYPESEKEIRDRYTNSIQKEKIILQGQVR